MKNPENIKGPGIGTEANIELPENLKDLEKMLEDVVLVLDSIEEFQQMRDVSMESTQQILLGYRIIDRIKEYLKYESEESLSPKMKGIKAIIIGGGSLDDIRKIFRSESAVA